MIRDTLKKVIPFPLAVKIRGGWQKMLRLVYSGQTYYCPYCDNNFRKFLRGGYPNPLAEEKKIVGAGVRPNMLCPRCYSTDRDRLIYLYLKEKTDVFVRPTGILHIAPAGSVKHLLESLPNVEYETGDKFEDGYRGYYYDRDVTQLDVTALPYADDSFDMVLCNHVLEHVPEDLKAMSEIRRVLKKGGQALLQVPVSLLLDKTDEGSADTPEERERRFGQFDHVRLYALDYKQRLEKAGFTVEVHNPERDGWGQEIERLAVNPLEDVYVAVK